MPFSDFRLAATATNRARAARFALMGAVAALALGAPAAASLAPARAETAVTAPAPATNAPTSFADVVDRVKPAVVAIKVKGVASDEAQEATGGLPGAPDMSPDDPMYHFFKRFGEQRPGGHLHGQMTMSQGSGFIVSADGYVVTNNHVVEHATEVEVTLDSGKSLPAKVIGTDKRTDLALIKINDGEKLPFVEWASGNPRIGDWVIAVGNPFGLGGSVTAGIVSARGRDIGSGPYDDFLQIDAPVNRGNSGGPAFDAQGRVIGVNTAIFSPSGGSVGIGFAIPAEVAKDVVASLREHGAVSRGWIGVKIQNITPEIAESMGLKSTKGALVSQPQRGGPADAAGLKAGDVVVAVNGEKIDGPRDLARRIAALGPKKSADILFLRGGAEKSVRLTLGALPEEKQARADTGAGGGAGEDVVGLGVEVAPAAEVGGAGREGVVVTDVDPDGAAALKGMRRGDVIVEASGRPINSGGDLASVLDSARSEGRKSVLLRVKSGDGMKYIALPTKVG